MECITKEELIDFEENLVERYANKEIRSPIHLSGSIDGNLEDFLVDLFKNVKPNDWIFTTYRSHYHALLKGVPKEWLLKWVLDNKSIHVMNKEHKIVTSAIVGGTLSQAVGCALAIRTKGSDEHVWCFCGDMTASLGVFRDCYNFSLFYDLPITFVIEDNGLSTDTPTADAWNRSNEEFYESQIDVDLVRKGESEKIKYISYKRKFPHYGAVGKDGKRVIVNFDDKTEEMKT